MNVRLKDLTMGSTASTLRNILGIAGVDVKPLDSLLGEQDSLAAQGKQVPKKLNESLSSAEAARLDTIKQAGPRARDAAATSSKAIDEMQSQGREASAGIDKNLNDNMAQLDETNPIIQGKSDLLLKGMTTQEIPAEAMNHLCSNAKLAGSSNPTGYILMTYGLMKMTMGNPNGIPGQLSSWRWAAALTCAHR